MKYRILYTDVYKSEKTMVIDEPSLWHAEYFGKKVFGEFYISCESLEPIPSVSETVYPDLDDFYPNTD